MRILASNLAITALAAGMLGIVGLECSAPAKAQGFSINAPGIHVWVGGHRHRGYYPPPAGYGYYDYSGNCYPGGCCPAHYTIQGGLCKPSRG